MEITLCKVINGIFPLVKSVETKMIRSLPIIRIDMYDGRTSFVAQVDDEDGGHYIWCTHNKYCTWEDFIHDKVIQYYSIAKRNSNVMFTAEELTNLINSRYIEPKETIIVDNEPMPTIDPPTAIVVEPVILDTETLDPPINTLEGNIPKEEKTEERDKNDITTITTLMLEESIVDILYHPLPSRQWITINYYCIGRGIKTINDFIKYVKERLPFSIEGIGVGSLCIISKELLKRGVLLDTHLNEIRGVYIYDTNGGCFHESKS